MAERNGYARLTRKTLVHDGQRPRDGDNTVQWRHCRFAIARHLRLLQHGNRAVPTQPNYSLRVPREPRPYSPSGRYRSIAVFNLQSLPRFILHAKAIRIIALKSFHARRTVTTSATANITLSATFFCIITGARIAMNNFVLYVEVIHMTTR
jgi:ribosomal protein L32E